MFRYLLVCLFLFSTAALAEEDVPEITDSPEVPEMPLPVQDGEPMDADITITRRGEKTIHEYRVNGKIYKIKVIPDIGPAYYFIDPDGDGEMEEVSESDLDSLIKINQWTIFSW
ncbi:MAG: DUF2782 domain-containing protein [Gammaproteobacteria bacterium]|nr:DUF2782 domain-containing protein [Gammaproteobacteria bacterium]MBT4147129.1 DUF2782 domain-containing protein [Gammaproteobacteria bacterium]MBT5223554.1 DUF2782 domain-containing protein [Gammaproteobacteria bacterium]MBT5825850.1 DUF2782 domain-containing protein [Gammaproteobacteria bacterium]MBT5966049.1 DUF2782 domain-containing protein [Gammaproteobacteria bacterium]